ncbi:MAG: energy-coupling factor transporter transmembrane protein EcfT [Anaerolineales bacterium]|nr:energy-coupling factor transporter transmembrane protein EcfT [Anaerolineales bacterium]
MLFVIVIGLKILTVVTVFPVLTATTPMPVFMAGLAKIRMPYKVIFTLGMAFRLVPLVNTTYQDITEAQQLRGHDLKSMPFFKKLAKGYIPLFVPLIVTLLRRAGDLDIAIESRGFGGQQERTYLSEITMGWRDWIFLSAFLVTFGFVLYLLFFGEGQGWFEYIDPT